MSLVDSLFLLSANPDEAHSLYSDFLKSFREQTHHDFTINEKNQAILSLFGNSTFLAQYLVQNPQAAEAYALSNYRQEEKPLTVFVKELGKKFSSDGHGGPSLPRGEPLCSSDNYLKILKTYKYQEYIRLTIKELEKRDGQKTYREFSHLASVILNVVLNHVIAEHFAKMGVSLKQVGGFALIAMGKLGGHELNYSSDVDLIGIYEEDESWGDLTRHEIFERVFSHFGKECQTRNQDRFLYRVDWDLRPEGKTGALANSLYALEQYYESFGQEWERQAFIKANIVGETGKTGERFLKFITPFVYRKSFDERSIKHIWEMKSRIVAELKQKSPSGINIKLDHGGIRDIEFFVQGFQLLHGGKTPALRHENTVSALLELGHAGIVPPTKIRLLIESYKYLRRLESCLQMDNEDQTHWLSQDNKAKFKVARRMGYQEESETAMSMMDEELAKIRAAVREIFAQYYGQE
jgi:glutamate-ammonia-ligase adenylyltransferase